MKKKEPCAHLNSKLIAQVLDPPQQQLWPLLNQVHDGFILYGGTAIALRLGHRKSIDFDFFSSDTFWPDELLRDLAFLNDGIKIQEKPNMLTLLVPVANSDNQVKISFFGNLKLGQINFPDIAENQISIASLEDLLGMKCATVSQRAEKKDYLDIHAIINKTSLSLSDGLAAARAIYGQQYNPVLTLKSLAYFKEGNVIEIPEDTKKDLLQAISTVNLARIPQTESMGIIGKVVK